MPLGLASTVWLLSRVRLPVPLTKQQPIRPWERRPDSMPPRSPFLVWCPLAAVSEDFHSTSITTTPSRETTTHLLPREFTHSSLEPRLRGFKTMSLLSP